MVLIMRVNLLAEVLVVVSPTMDLRKDLIGWFEGRFPVRLVVAF